ncbi:quinohemoprotein amine dehydrogenase subunit alpha [Pseudomonas sp. zbq_4]|uniref:quinohemoprotein amine dehydrogenase subunit alpha n=1 Tax=Pseudomonas TaxID=286 RepID=UPI00370B55F7
MKSLKHLAVVSSYAGSLLFLPAVASAQTGEEVLNSVCAACHIKRDDGKLERIDSVRKTPEAWDMTVVRMMRNHHVPLSQEDRTEVVRYLASTRGLSVAETQGRRYVLEKEPVAVDEAPSQLMAETCGRCHSFARVALQRRTPDDWEKLLNFHLGQFPSLELQALARDRDWWGVAHSEVLPFLAKNFPLGQAPQQHAEALQQDWIVAGHQPGNGDYSGALRLEKAKDSYNVTLRYEINGKKESYQGKGVLLGDGEWRATLSNGTSEIHQVLELSKQGELSGRWFNKRNAVEGGRILAIPKGSPSRVIQVSPAYARVNAATEITITGSNLTGKLALPPELNGSVISQTADKVVVKVTPTSAVGLTKFSVGDADASMVIFSKLDRLAVEPTMAISRVGGNGGPIPKTPAQFEAVGYLNGVDGKPGTDDDVRVGVFGAKWSVDNWDEAAAAKKDSRYTGSIDEKGLFTPADAGPNPERQMSTNNVGNLKVIAQVDDQGKTIGGEAHLYATVQRFIDPPIR